MKKIAFSIILMRVVLSGCMGQRLPGDVTLNCGADKEAQCGTAWAFDIPTAVSSCSPNNVLIEVISTVTNVASPRCPQLFSVTRTWRATDACTNTAICNQTVTIVDTEPPNITCGSDKEVQCGTDWAFDIPTAVDKCDLNNVLIEVVATVTNTATPRCPRIFSVTRTWRTTDTCGNSAFCNQTVTIVDTEPPNITCGSDKEVQCGTDWAFDIPTAVDKCDLNNVLIEVVATVTNTATPRCPRIFSVTRTWRTTDTCGNSAFCNQTVTIVDTEPPNITCGSDKEVQCGTDWAFDIPTAVDKCDRNNVLIEVVATVTNTAAPRCPRIFSVTRTWRTTDTCGNAAFCNQTVTIVDTEPPNITCHQNKEVQCGQAWAFDIPTAVDKCDLNNVLIEVVSTVTNVASPRCPQLFNVTRTWRTTDTCGNAAFCNQTVTIVDTEPPTITCHQNKAVQCGQAWAFDIPTAVDNCDLNNVLIEVVSTVTNVASPRCPQLFSVTRTWRATDTCGNAAFCNQTVTVVDTEPPNLTCADDLIIECDGQWSFTPPAAADACDGTNVTISIVSTVTNVLTGDFPKLYTATRTWRASDTCGNATFCSQKVTVVDTTPPNITCADDLIVECDGGWSFTPPTAADVCYGTNVTITIVSTVTNILTGEFPKLYTATRTWRATDPNGNFTTCSQKVTVVDTTPPNITCADDLIVECDGHWSFTPPYAADVCYGTNVTITITSTVTNILTGESPKLWTATRTWRATDPNGNFTTCSQKVTVVDTTPPNITCADDRIVECGIPWSFTAPYAVDVCNRTNVTITIVSTVTNVGLCGNTYSATRTWRATDSSGNWATCNQTIAVVDTRPPALTCAGDRLVECGIPWSFTRPSAVDICDGTNVTVAVVSTVTNALCGATFAATRTWSATDQCGNLALCSQTIALVDTAPPTITCAPDKTVQCAQAWDFDVPSANDLCAGTNVAITIVSTVTNAGSGGTVVLTRTWKADDGCGNTASCSQTVTVLPCPQGGGCRVTGGSSHQNVSFQAACIATPVPAYFSHGGQVGAPFSVVTPFTPNSPAISGEWQHNRHFLGNSQVGTFHASGNGHESQFDSLLCACLPCSQNPNVLGVVAGLCNPGDKVCGPQPRYARANKICFSGVGDYTDTTGHKTVKAVFRVDIEDRSEGNSPSSTSPPDRYRIRFWLLDPSCGRNPDPNSAEAMALRIAASADPSKIANLATTEELKVNIPPDIDEGGDMIQGNHQIHPSTGAQFGGVFASPAAAIDVATEVASLTSGNPGAFGKVAHGHPGLQDPAFAYRINITNCGPVTLTNLVVAETSDTILENTTGLYFALGEILPPGGWLTRYYTNTWNKDTINTVFVAGNSSQDGASVVAASTAVAAVSVVPQPRLAIRVESRNLILEWPVDTASGFVLETTTDLTPPVNWSVISNAANPFVVPNTSANPARFFRLRLP